MEFLSIAKQRFSVRSYTSQHVEPEKLEKILEAARVAPHCCQSAADPSDCRPK